MEQDSQRKRQGRPSLSKDGESPKEYIRLTHEQKSKLKKLGGAKWVREQIDNAVDNDGLIEAPF